MTSNNQDRGAKKWNSLFIPEHLERIREWYAEDQLTERPSLTEWDLQSIQEEIELAYKSRSETFIKTWKNGRISFYKGIVKELRVHQSIIVLEDPFCDEYLLVEDIISVSSLP